MNGYECRMSARQSSHAGLSAMRGTVVHDPEHATGCVVRWLAHDMLDQSLEGLDASGWLTASEQFDPMHVERSQVGSGAATLILMLDAHRHFRRDRQARMNSKPRLDAGLLVSRNDELVLA